MSIYTPGAHSFAAGLRSFAAMAFLLIIAWGEPLFAGRTDEIYRDYIERYAPMAVEQQKSYGIPASVTIAQGLLESGAGRSRLAREGNNHFGIKCHKEWQGDTMLRSDDAPNECFRVYPDALQSFEDHSRFLTRKRYAPLFQLEGDDYAGWCQGLSRCGYATDPNYASRLIAIIERYELYQYDIGSTHHAAETADFIIAQLKQSHAVRRSRGLHYVIANPGDTYASIAAEMGVDAHKLSRLNDSEDANSEIRPWEEVYLEPKHTEGPEKVKRVTIGEGETIHSIAQRFGMQESALRALNPGIPDAEGKILRLH